MALILLRRLTLQMGDIILTYRDAIVWADYHIPIVLVYGLAAACISALQTTSAWFPLLDRIMFRRECELIMVGLITAWVVIESLRATLKFALLVCDVKDISLEASHVPDVSALIRWRWSNFAIRGLTVIILSVSYLSYALIVAMFLSEVCHWMWVGVPAATNTQSQAGLAAALVIRMLTDYGELCVGYFEKHTWRGRWYIDTDVKKDILHATVGIGFMILVAGYLTFTVLPWYNGGTLSSSNSLVMIVGRPGIPLSALILGFIGHYKDAIREAISISHIYNYADARWYFATFAGTGDWSFCGVLLVLIYGIITHQDITLVVIVIAAGVLNFAVVGMFSMAPPMQARFYQSIEAGHA